MPASETGGFPGALTFDFTRIFGTPISGMDEGALARIGRSSRSHGDPGALEGCCCPTATHGDPRAPEGAGYLASVTGSPLAHVVKRLGMVVTHDHACV